MESEDRKPHDYGSSSPNPVRVSQPALDSSRSMVIVHCRQRSESGVYKAPQVFLTQQQDLESLPLGL